MSEETQQSISFLLSLWHVKENDHTVWRYSLESSHPGERWDFSDLDALCAFLSQQTVALSDFKTKSGRLDSHDDVNKRA